MSVLRLSTLALSLSLISGCGTLWPSTPEVKTVEIQKKEVARTPLNLSEPSPLKPRSMNWFIVTPENVDSVWEKLKNQNTDLVLIGLTDDGYESLAMTIAEIRNYIASQKSIIKQYKEYYEPKKEEQTKK